MVGTFHSKKKFNKNKDEKKGMVKLATIFVDWSSRCHGNHSRFEIQRRGPVHPVTQSTKDGERPKTSDMLLLVIIYSLSCCVKPIRLTFFRGTEKEKL